MLQEAVDEYIASLSLRTDERAGNNQNTIVAYRNDLNQFCGYMKQQELGHWSQVTREHIAGYLLALREGRGYRSTTMARKQAALKSFFRYLKSTGIIREDPTDLLKTPRVQKEPPHVLSAEQVNALFHQIEVETPVGKRDFAMLQMLYATGMRVTELISLNLDDFDAKQAVVTCSGRNGRNRRERVLSLPSPVVEATQEYVQAIRPHLVRNHPEEQALFVNHHGQRLTRQGFWLIIKGYARQAGITEITPHMLRHSFALLMLKEGKELRSVQEMLGHAHITTTQVYSQLVRPKRTTTV